VAEFLAFYKEISGNSVQFQNTHVHSCWRKKTLLNLSRQYKPI